MKTSWQNWSGSQIHGGNGVVFPQSNAELANILKHASKQSQTVRVIGSGHSFVPFWTDDVLISLDSISGLIAVNGQYATYAAGTKLHTLGDELWVHDLSMANMGDIDRQSLAGAISTGTHGTGITLPSISSQVVALKLMLANGDIVDVDQTQFEWLKAARISLGCLGVVTEVTLALDKSYHLHEKTWTASIQECDSTLASLILSNRHFEFFWDPQSDRCDMKSLNKCDVGVTLSDPKNTIEMLNSGDERVDRHYRIFPSSRDLKFNEMEFTLEYKDGWPCFLEIRNLVLTKYSQLRWPVEYRTVKADDAYLSPTIGKDSVTISIHESNRRDFEPYFSDVEAIFRRYGAKPHWGKIHQHTAADFRSLIPDFSKFCDIRQEFDPEGRFLNPFLSRIFGVD